MAKRYKTVTLEDNEDITAESYERSCNFGATLHHVYSALPPGEPERPAINDTVTPPEQCELTPMNQFIQNRVRKVCSPLPMIL